MPLRVFISHATENVAFAQQLARDLRRAGADVWLDTSHIGPGDFVARISEALNNRDVLVLVLSPAALRSQWVPDEVNAAIVRYKQGFMRAPLIVLAQPVPLRDIPGLWTTYHRFDATADYHEVLPDIVQALGLTMPVAPPAPPPARPVAPPIRVPGQGEQLPPPSHPHPAPLSASSAPVVSRRKLLATTGAGLAGLAAAGGAAWLILSRGADKSQTRSSPTPTATPSPTPGTQRWRFPAGNPASSSPVVASGVVYVGSYDGYLYAVDA